ncbi:heterokaryon incompatibility protein-domain-containing protein [Whalleya microplaca]|nr:heterokaryon incompatibility protein-domain-containing protein [Whalleya microplaca]
MDPSSSLTQFFLSDVKSTIQTCAACRQILWALWGTKGFESIKVHDDIRSIKCPGHSALVHSLQKNPTRFRNVYGHKLSEFNKLTLIKWDGPETVFVFRLPEDTEFLPYARTSVALAHKVNVPGHGGQGRILDPKWIDLGILSRWRSRCMQLHGEKCDNPMGIDPVDPTWLIDMKLQCLVPGQGRADFVALSYRWGDAGGLRATSESLSELQTPGIFLDPEISQQIPWTILHAMRIVKTLGLRYFWVDALCIPQDDETIKRHEIGRMAAIYSSAVVTIIAGDGDASTGLLGLPGISEPRNLKQRIYPFLANEQVIETENSRYHTHIPDSYVQRGWTFQEYHMSKRRIIFSGQKVNWECGCAIWREDQIPYISQDAELILGKTHLLARTMREFPGTEGYVGLVNEYSRCSFTYEEDVLPAISGTFSLMTRTFPKGFLCGIPEIFFDLFMIWLPGFNGMKRRISGLSRMTQADISLPAQSASKSRTVCLPSWSWIGWKGHCSIHGNTESYMRKYCARNEYTSIVEWYTSDETTGPWRKVDSEWYSYIQDARDYTKPLPHGWSRLPWDPEKGNTCLTDLPGDLGYYFTHPSCPGVKFIYPLPTSEEGASQQPNLIKTSPFLSCQSNSLKLTLVRLAAKNHWYDGHGNIPYPGFSYYGFKDVGGKVIGILYPNDYDDVRKLFSGTDIDVAEGNPILYERKLNQNSQETTESTSIPGLKVAGSKCIELVAILQAAQWTYPMLEIPVYVALWVEWEDGIFYRKGIGAIAKDFWEAQKVTPISLILG